MYAEDLKCVSLGSRKNLCINEEVRKLKSINRINEKCLNMQKAGIYKGIIKGKVKKLLNCKLQLNIIR